ncbi:MAG: hypothetical protein RLZZ292_2969 [Bacteroidota bacterium]|jgi:hypothetical protein
MKTSFLFSIIFFFSFQLVAQDGVCVRGNDGAYYDLAGKPCTNTVLSAVPFLRIAPDARSAGMGEAGIATAQDASALHFNASKLVFLESSNNLTLNYAPWLRPLDSRSNGVFLYGAYYGQLNKRQAIGVSYRSLTMKEVDYTNAAGEATGSGPVREGELNIAFAQRLSSKFSVAVSGKFVRSNLVLDQIGALVIVNFKSDKATAFDLSSTYTRKLRKEKDVLTVALAASNLFSKIGYSNLIYKDYLPANLGLGVAYRREIGQKNSIIFTTELNKLLVPIPQISNDTVPINLPIRYASLKSMARSFHDAPGGFREELHEIMVSTGVEWAYKKAFFLRTGYFYEHKTKGNRKFLTFGIGGKYKTLEANLSYLKCTTQYTTPLDNTMRFSILIRV